MQKYILNRKDRFYFPIKIECELVTPLQDPTVIWSDLKGYSFKHNNQYVIYYNNIYDSLSEAKQQASLFNYYAFSTGT